MSQKKPVAECLSAWLCGNEGKLNQLIRESKFDWLDLVQLAAHELVLPALHSARTHCSSLRDLPEELTEFLKFVADSNLERNQQIVRDLAGAVSLLNTAGIEPVLLKGLAYFYLGVYDDWSARYMTDIDLLVPESELTAAVELLRRNGYLEDTGDAMGRYRHHHPPLRSPGGTWIELHHSLGPDRCRRILPAAEMIGRSQRLEREGVVFRVPCPTDLAIHNVLHTQLVHSYRERIWPPLSSLFDLVQLKKRFSNEIDWHSLRAQFRIQNEQSVVDLYFLQARHSLDFAIPDVASIETLTWARWCRRRFLQIVPVLRFLDPIYLFSVTFRARINILMKALQDPLGRKPIMSTLMSTKFFRRLSVDLFAR